MRFPSLITITLALSCGLPEPEPTPDPGSTFPNQPTEQRALGLTSFSGPTACAELERHIEDRAVLEMRVNVETSKRYALQWFDWRHGGTGGGSGSFSDAGSAAGGSGGGGGGSGGTAAPADYTTTNTQLAGVDEPDIIKNDGTRLFVASGRRLFTATTWPAASLATRGSVEIGGRPFELFLDGDRVVVFSHLFEPSFGAPSWCQQQTDCGGWYSNATLVTHLDVSDLANPTVVATQRVPGRYESARRVGPIMRLVTTASMPFLDGQQTWVDWQQQEQATSTEQLERLFDTLADFNEGQIRRRDLGTWLPSALLTSGSTSATAQLQCTDISTTTASARLGLTSIVSLDMNDPLAFSRQTLLASVDELYQGPESLYLAQRHWWWWGNGGSTTHEDQTYLYRFDLSQPDRVTFVAAARLAGRPLNQFSFDEHQGVLRVATTVTSTTTWQTVNRVLTFGGALQELGRTEDLAPGERIMSARFVGDTAYIVTFRQVDPLYVIDLSDPANPHKVGELKIPGFSSYIHPLDATHLLTIGTYVPEVPSTSWERHLQLQIFDVSDPAAPRQTHSQLVGRAWGWSEAQWNHKAFNYFPARGLLAVPFSDWYTDEFGQYQYVSDLRVFGVDPVSGFTPKGTLQMKDVLERQDCSQGACWGWYWEPQVRRSVMADDCVYAISSGGVRVAHVDSLSTPIATARFTPAP